jgi:hypothetical protein
VKESFLDASLESGSPATGAEHFWSGAPSAGSGSGSSESRAAAKGKGKGKKAAKEDDDDDEEMVRSCFHARLLRVSVGLHNLFVPQEPEEETKKPKGKGGKAAAAAKAGAGAGAGSGGKVFAGEPFVFARFQGRSRA